MESRGWKPSCPPRVPDECLTVPYVDSWEETANGFDPPGPGCGQPDENGRLALPAVAVAQAEDGATCHEDDPCSDKIRDSSESPPLQQEDDDAIASSRRACQPWDLHWSYTKWAVETMRFARKLAPWQKVNHFRNSNELCRKVFQKAHAETVYGGYTNTTTCPLTALPLVDRQTRHVLQGPSCHQLNIYLEGWLGLRDQSFSRAPITSCSPLDS